MSRDRGSRCSEREAALPRAPRRALVDELWAREGDDEDRPWLIDHQDRLDEVDEPRVGPLEVLEDEDGRRPISERSKNVRQAANSSSRSPGGASASPSRCASRGSIHSRSSSSGTKSCDARGELRAARSSASSSSLMPRAHPDHLAERAEGDALAVGCGASLVPVEGVGEPVDVLEELPGEPALADAGDAGDRDESRALLARRRVQEVLDEPQLVVSTDERRLEALGSAEALALRDDAQRPPGAHDLVLALERELAELVEGDRREDARQVDSSTRTVPGRGRALHPRGGVHGVAQHHALGHFADRDRRPRR